MMSYFLSTHRILRAAVIIGLTRLRRINRVVKLNTCTKIDYSNILAKYHLLTPSLAIVSALGFGSTKKTENESPEEKLIKQADELYNKNQHSQIYDILIEHKNSKNVEIVWRLSRAAYKKAQETENVEKKQLMYEAYDFIQNGLKLDQNSFAVHKWYGILLDIVGEYEGVRKRIENSFEVKKHFERAMELNPVDATSIYTLGYWHFLFADMPWYQRKIASVIFASPPESTFQEALTYFLKAEETEPNFYSMNLLNIGKCYLRMNKNDLAKIYLKKARDYQGESVDDKRAHTEATDLLKGLE